jgi:hypothetical protein
LTKPLSFAFLPLALFTAGVLSGQQPSKNWTAAEDHQNMMEQLGIRALRPGPSGNESAPNHANYDEALANRYPNLPAALVLKNGKKVTMADVWWKQRRPEIVEDFDREVLGRVPRNVPKVTWTVTNTVQATVGSRPVVGKQLVGHVDNASYPAINVDIQMTLVTPAESDGMSSRTNSLLPVARSIRFTLSGSPRWVTRTDRRSADHDRTLSRFVMPGGECGSPPASG